jgi:exonuclease III
MNDLSASNIHPDILCLQEIWQVQDVNTVAINEYDFVYKKRSKFRGGGVGCYIRKGIQYKILEIHSIFIEKIFECLTLEATLNGKKIIFCNFYRPPMPHPNYTPSEQLDCFFENFSLLLNDLSGYNTDVYVFSDTNINLIDVQQGSRGASLLETALEHGFLQTNKKITRFGDHVPSLIDHVFTNSIGQGVRTGSVIIDISDHLITFIQPEGTRLKVSREPTYRRSFNHTNLSNFRNSLSALSWNNVMQCNFVDEAYNLFWSDFKTFFDLHFPLKKQKFNKNFHSKNKFITQGILVSRRRKNELLKLHVKSRTPESKEIYCNYRNMYNKIVRASKKLYYREHISANKKDPKKLWGLLKEVSTGELQVDKIEKISENGNSFT